MEEENKQKVVDILPIKKGRRMLVFLGDFFINFMLSFLLITIAVLPLGKVFTKYGDRNSKYTNDLVLRADILYENKVLFDSGKVDRSEIVYNASYTYYVYLSYFVYDIENPDHVKFPQYGHKEENNIFRHYFIDLINDPDSYISLFDHYNSKNQYFERTDVVVTLKPEYKSEILTFFDTSDKPTKSCKKYMSNIEKNIFYPMYSEMMTLIQKHDLKDSKGHSYNKVNGDIKSFETYINNLAISTSLIAFTLSTSILHLLIPLLNKHRKTLTMMILKVERVDIRSLSLLKKGKTVLSFIYSLFSMLLITFFAPIGLLTIYEIFNISILFVLGLFSIAIILSSFVFLLFNRFNRTLFDYFTGTVMLTNDSLDEVYRSRGYII